MSQRYHLRTLASAGTASETMETWGVCWLVNPLDLKFLKLPYAKLNDFVPNYRNKVLRILKHENLTEASLKLLLRSKEENEYDYCNLTCTSSW